MRHPLLIASLFLLAQTAAPAQSAGPNDILPEAPAKVLVVRACTGCHAAPQIVVKRHTAEEWDEVVAKMVDRGAKLSEPEQDQVYAYLVRYFGPQPSRQSENLQR
jgi:hypothetical protein